ncbi:hypothetical protein OROHE_023786 [Orobanche hederae]
MNEKFAGPDPGPGTGTGQLIPWEGPAGGMGPLGSILDTECDADSCARGIPLCPRDGRDGGIGPFDNISYTSFC